MIITTIISSIDGAYASWDVTSKCLILITLLDYQKNSKSLKNSAKSY